MNKSHLIHKSSFHLPFFLENKVAFYCTSGGLFLFFLTFHFVSYLPTRELLPSSQKIGYSCVLWHWRKVLGMWLSISRSRLELGSLAECIMQIAEWTLPSTEITRDFVCVMSHHTAENSILSCVSCVTFLASLEFCYPTVLCKSGTNKGVCCNLPLLQVVLQTFAFLAVINIPF